MQTAEPTHAIYAKGEMADKIRSFNWSSTSVGPISGWPASLLTAVNLLLDSGFPMFIWWGSDRIQFYNDAYLKILGIGENSKHPAALGQKGELCWKEIWAAVNPLIEGVLQTGDSVYHEDQLIPVYRNGMLDDVYWTFSYNPIRRADGKPEGILVVCTETTKTNRQLQENEEQLQRVLDNMAEGVGITDRAGNILYVNPMAHQILGAESDRFPSRKSNSPEWFNTHSDGSPMADNEHPAAVAMATGKPVFNYEFTIDRPGSSRMYISMNAAPITDKEGKITGSVSMFSDITGRKQAEEALREARDQSEQQRRLYETIISATPDLIYVFGLDYKFTYVNRALLEMWGKTWDTAVGKGLRENGYEEWHALMHEREIDHIRETKETVRGEVGFPHAILGRRVYDYILRPVVDENGEVVAVAGTTRDITDIKNAESAIAESEARFRLMAEGTNVMIAVGDETGAAVYFNQAWADATGRTTEDLLRFGWVDLMHPDDKDYVLKIFTDAFQERKPWEWEFRMPDKRGGYRWLWASGVPRFQADGSFAGYISSCVNITEQKEQREHLQKLVDELQAINEELAATNEEVESINEELQQTQEHLVETNSRLHNSEKELLAVNARLAEGERMLQLAMDSSGMSTWQAYFATDEMVMHEKARIMHGIPKDVSVPFSKSYEMIDPAHRAAVERHINEAFRNKTPFLTEYLMHPLDGSPPKWLRASGSVQFDNSRKPLSIWGAVLDITEQKQNEQRKNDFISMVSHELKTPLTSTISYVQVSQKKAAANGDTVAVGMLARAGVQLGKMTTLINGFLDVSRLEAGKIHIEKRRIDMALLIREVEEGVVPEASSHTIIFTPVEETWVSVDRDKIEQVINNFISNAIKYSSPNTNIQIACATINNYARVSVTDEGIGVKPQDHQKLFDRYYRVDGQETSSISGFGIGLYICKEIVERHEGKIGVDSQPGKGSTFWFTLPVDADPE